MDWQLATGVSSILVACCALGISIWQVTLSRNHNKISFRPHLTTWEHSRDADVDIAVDLMNNGIGPALFTSFTVMVDDRIQEGEGVKPFEKALKILFENYNYTFQASHFGPGYSMSPKESQRLIAIKFTEKTTPSLLEIDDAMKRTKIKILYKSFYGEEFELVVTKDKIT